MDEAHDLILKTFEANVKRQDLQSKMIQENLTAGFDLLAKELHDINESNKIRNGRIEKLEKRTAFIGWIQNNFKIAIFIGIVGYFGLKFVFSYISVIDILKKYLP